MLSQRQYQLKVGFVHFFLKQITSFRFHSPVATLERMTMGILKTQLLCRTIQTSFKVQTRNICWLAFLRAFQLVHNGKYSFIILRLAKFFAVRVWLLSILAALQLTIVIQLPKWSVTHYRLEPLTPLSNTTWKLEPGTILTHQRCPMLWILAIQ